MATEVKVSSSAVDFCVHERHMLIGGDWVEAASGKTFEAFNPATGDVLANVAEGDSEDIDRAVKTARAAFESGPWATMTPSERGRVIHRIGDLILEHGDELADARVARQRQADARSRARPTSRSRPTSSTTLRAGPRSSTARRSTVASPYMPGAEFHAYTLREPVGVVGQIIPWNFPLLMAAWKLGPALACGCTIVLKPAEQTPLSALRLGELILEAGRARGRLNIVTGFGETAGAALAAHDDVDKVAFTGSTEVGKLIVQAAAGNLKKVTLELGGKSPNIVFADADMETAIPGAANAIFFNHGQCCCAGSRLFVEKKVFDEVARGRRRARARTSRSAPASTRDRDGPAGLARSSSTACCGFLDSGRDEGAKAVAGGSRDRRARATSSSRPS